MPTVQFFATCIVDTFYPETAEAIVSILRRLGVNVEFPMAQTCCGQPQFNSGLPTDARRVAEYMIETFEENLPKVSKPSEDCYIVTPSGSCTHMLRHNYPDLFAKDPDWLKRAQALAKRTYEFTEYLVDVLEVTNVGATWEGMLTYHPSCHLSRGLEIERQPRALLAQVKGTKLVELPEASDCCGFGGIFSITHPELSGELLQRKIGNLEKTKAPSLVITDAGCIMHIAGGLHRRRIKQRVVHIAEILNNT
ncbi:MAG: (Fe-S)-binding protein [Anaerolineae bacterium]|nr:(Fe-S)-binding protein [Anaerolineae bacterium]MDK1080368.1 (Fe-S)-binding protein [Anaerolineae bacterium]